MRAAFQALSWRMQRRRNVPLTASLSRNRERGIGYPRLTREPGSRANRYGLVGAGAAGLLKSTVGAVEIAFSFSTEKFAFVL